MQTQNMKMLFALLASIQVKTKTVQSAWQPTA